jgi:Peptidase M15
VAATKARGRGHVLRDLPKPGTRYFDTMRGEWMIRPRSGRKAVALHSPEGERELAPQRERGGFSARDALRRTGVRVGERGSRAGRYAGRRVAAPTLAAGRGFGDLALWALGAVLGLAILDLALSPRGSSGVSRVLDLASGGFSKLLDPHDPIIGKGEPAPLDIGAGVPPESQAVAERRAGVAPEILGGLGRAGHVRGRLVPLAPDVTQGHRRILLDSRFAGEAAAIARRFGVKISSGYRDPAHNAEVGGARNSDHLRGDAADFVGSPAALAALRRWAQGRFPYIEPPTPAEPHVHISFARG